MSCGFTVKAASAILQQLLPYVIHVLVSTLITPYIFVVDIIGLNIINPGLNTRYSLILFELSCMSLGQVGLLYSPRQSTSRL